MEGVKGVGPPHAPVFEKEFSVLMQTKMPRNRGAFRLPNLVIKGHNHDRLSCFLFLGFAKSYKVMQIPENISRLFV
jgi:hypothetical protein